MSENFPKKQPILLIVVLNLTLICLIIGIIAGFYLLKQNKAEQTPATSPERQIKTPGEKPETPVTVGENFWEYPESDLVYSGEAPVYVTLYSHNEDTWTGQVGSKIKYAKYREDLLERVNLLDEYEIEWDWQTDQTVVEAMIEYENDPRFFSETDGKNILEYMTEHGVNLDPHVHTNNYADVVYLIEQLGVKASPVIGGLRYVDCGKEYLGFLDFLSWHDEISLSEDGYVYGEDFPEAKWRPEILSCPSMGGHWYDDGSSGIWRPGDEDDFYSDFSDNGIIYIAQGLPSDSVIIGEHHSSGAEVSGANGQYIKELVGKITNKELPTGTKDGKKFIYTASLHFRDTAIVTDDGGDIVTVEGLRQVLDELQPLKDSGQIIFANFEDVAAIWQNEYDSVPWRVDLSGFSFYDEAMERTEAYCKEKASR